MLRLIFCNMLLYIAFCKKFYEVKINYKGTAKTEYSHNNTKLQYFIKKNNDDSFELSLELINIDNLCSTTTFIHAKFLDFVKN